MNAERPGAHPAVYSAGALGASMLLQTILLWAVYFYAPPSGATRLRPEWMGLALAGGRIVNALSNPPVAFWSDRLRTRWGRRRPFLAVGAPALAVCFALLWIPPSLPPVPMFLYVLAVLIGFFFCFSFSMNPYAALLPDITPGGRGRVVVASWQAGASVGGVGIAMISSAWLIAHAGFGAMGAAIGAAALAMLWTVAAGVREPAPAVGAAPPAFWREIGGVLRDPAFRVYVVSLSLLWIGTSMVNSAIVYVITVLMGLPQNSVGVVLGVTFVCTLGAFPLLARLTRTLGTPRMLRWTLAVASVVIPLIGAIGLRGVPGAPAVQGFVLVVLAAAPLAGLLVLPNALLADIAEAGHERTGEGREAMYYAVQGLILNAASAGSSALLGVLLALGDSPGHSLGLRLIPVVGGGCTLLALLAFLPFSTGAARASRGAPSR
ncbi:MAG TPA: MFS transporter [bacterium]|nr:MFS transporter [bacterium]